MRTTTIYIYSSGEKAQAMRNDAKLYGYGRWCEP